MSSRTLKTIAVAGTLLFLTTLSACSAKNSRPSVAPIADCERPGVELPSERLTPELLSALVLRYDAAVRDCNARLHALRSK